MRISDLQEKPISSQRIPFDANGESCYIEVTSTSTKRYSNGVAWFKRACAEKINAGIELMATESAAGEEIAIKSEEYLKLEAILFAHVVVDWGLDDDVTLDSAASLIIRYPEIRDLIDEATSMLAYAEMTAKKPQAKLPKENSNS